MSKHKSPAFQFYPKDFLSDANVVCLTNEELGAYVRLLCHCWLEGSLPADDRKLGKLANCGKRWGHIRSSVIELFSKTDGNRYIHTRLEIERRKQLETRQKRKKAAEKRWEKGDANANQKVCPPSSSPSSIATALKKEPPTICSPPTKTVDAKRLPTPAHTVTMPDGSTRKFSSEKEATAILNAAKWYNALAAECSLSKVAKWTDGRVASLRARYKEGMLDHLDKLAELIRTSDFLLGITGNDAWKGVHVDFLFGSPRNWAKILEGRYVNRPKKVERYEL